VRRRAPKLTVGCRRTNSVGLTWLKPRQISAGFSQRCGEAAGENHSERSSELVNWFERVQDLRRLEDELVWRKSESGPERLTSPEIDHTWLFICGYVDVWIWPTVGGHLRLFVKHLTQPQLEIES